MRLVKLTSPFSSNGFSLGLRIAIIVGIVAFLSGLPADNIPTTSQIYKAALAAALAAFLLLENTQATANSSTVTLPLLSNQELGSQDSLPTVTCPNCGKRVPFGNFCDMCSFKLRGAT